MLRIRDIELVVLWLKTSFPIPRPDLSATPTIDPPESKREPLKILVIGSPQGVTHTIQTLHRLGFAQVGEWSPLVPTQNPGEVMSLLMRRLRLSDF